jgi:hypothetical protein
MSSNHPVISSSHPLDALIDEERNNGQTADDIVFVTYNFDPSFFENRLLGLCQATGAATTVISDAHIWNPDPRSLIAAGKTYHLGLASVPGAFHPKIMIITGPDRATIAIGSGNLTLGGWQYNAELCTVIRAHDGLCPAIVEGIATWLELLANEISLDTLSRTALLRSSSRLTALVESSTIVETGHTFVHNLIRPIIAQLPEGTVENLYLYAPFHDPRSQAVAALTRRFEPDSLDLAVQPGYTILNADALRDVLSQTPAASTIYADAEIVNQGGRYRHGKLVEWKIGSSRNALTGSPNLSVAALLRTASDGNCEIGIIAPVEESLFPTGDIIDIDSVPTVPIKPTEKFAGENRKSTPVILGVTIDDEFLFVELSAPAPDNLWLEISHRNSPPEDWNDLGELEPSISQHTVRIQVKAGSRVRLRWMANDGTVETGPSVPVTDPEQTQRRWRGKSSGVGNRFSPEDQGSLDISALNYLQRELLELARQLSSTRPPRITTGQDRENKAHSGPRLSDTDIEPWLWNEDAESQMAESLRAFALGLPTITGVQHVDIPTWTEKTDIIEITADDDEVVDDDFASEIEEFQSDKPNTQSNRDDDPDLRRRRRDWCWKIEKIESKLPLPAQMAALRVVLGLYCLGNWDYANDDDALTLIRNLLVGLDVEEGTAAQQISAASLAGVAIAMVRDRMSFDAHTQATLQFDHLAEKFSEILKGADRQYISEYSLNMINRNDAPLELEYVWETINAITSKDALARLIAGARDLDWDITRIGASAAEISGNFTQPSGALTRALSIIDEDLPIAIRTQSTNGWAAAAWISPNLYIVEPGRTKQRWRHWHLGGLVGPSALATQMRLQDGSLPATVDHGPQFHAIPEALTAFSDLGMPLEPKDR